MASYVDANLLAQEKVLYRAHTSLWSLAPLILLGILLLVVVVGLFVLIWAWIKYKTTEFAVTDRRVIAKSGLIARRTVEMFLDKVESLNVEQSVPGRLFDYGSVMTGDLPTRWIAFSSGGASRSGGGRRSSGFLFRYWVTPVSWNELKNFCSSGRAGGRAMAVSW